MALREDNAAQAERVVVNEQFPLGTWVAFKTPDGRDFAVDLAGLYLVIAMAGSGTLLRFVVPGTTNTTEEAITSEEYASVLPRLAEIDRARRKV